mmetsp:Transcript_29166/g.72079  ORF Transcript_29166/g.72079 Transcript_29166/m.72079 type:complete len:372 (-) Transcript_29166:2384-3499(-)
MRKRYWTLTRPRMGSMTAVGQVSLAVESIAMSGRLSRCDLRLRSVNVYTLSSIMAWAGSVSGVPSGSLSSSPELSEGQKLAMLAALGWLLAMGAVRPRSWQLSRSASMSRQYHTCVAALVSVRQSGSMRTSDSACTAFISSCFTMRRGSVSERVSFGCSCVASNTPGTGVLSFLTLAAYSLNSPPLPPSTTLNMVLYAVSTTRVRGKVLSSAPLYVTATDTRKMYWRPANSVFLGRFSMRLRSAAASCAIFASCDSTSGWSPVAVGQPRTRVSPTNGVVSIWAVTLHVTASVVLAARLARHGDHAALMHALTAERLKTLNGGVAGEHQLTENPWLSVKRFTPTVARWALMSEEAPENTCPGLLYTTTENSW